MTISASAIGDGAGDAQAARHVRTVVGRSGSSFLWGMRLLPRFRREAMFAVYAFCREVDDIADGTAPAREKQAGLAWWREEIDRLFAGQPTTQITTMLLTPVARFGLEREAFLAIVDGMEMDAGAGMRAPDWHELELYCARVAGSVGRLSVRIFGATGPRAGDVARTLGEALQLTNILRDLVEDAALGRLYLPRELLQSEGITSTDPEIVLGDLRIGKVCDALAARSRRRFDEAEAAIAACGRRPLRPATVMMQVYRRYLDRLVARGWDKLGEPVRVSKFEKFLIGLRYGLI